MISRERNEPAEAAIAARVHEWHQGQIPNLKLAPDGVPYLPVVPGYSLDDVRYNCVGRPSPAQTRQATKTLLARLVGTAFGGAFVGLFVAHVGVGVVTLTWLILLGFFGLKAVFDFHEIRAGHISQADGDIWWTELKQDSETADQFFVHIDNLRLKVTKQAYEALSTGGPYRIYYVPRAKRAVGGQVLPDWRPLPPPVQTESSWWRWINVQG
jgi:hypothetical protein